MKRHSNQLGTHFNASTATCLFALVVILPLGCSSSEKPAEEEKPPVTTTKNSTDTKKKNDTTPEKKKEAPPEKPDPAVVWAGSVEKTKNLIAAEDFDVDAIQKSIEELKAVYVKPEEPSEEQLAELAAIEKEVAAKIEENTSKLREEKLISATSLMDAGKLDEAMAALDFVLGRVPTDEQRKNANNIKDEIERRRSARRKLRTWMKLLGSEKRAEVRAAQNELYREPETSLPMLMDSLHDTENPLLVKNSMELMRRMRRPKITLPAIVGVLSRIEQKESWSDAVSEISRSSNPGAGPLLLELFQSSKIPEQRNAALDALSRVVDPPTETFITLLPLLYQDGPELVPALKAAYNAIRANRQYDLVSRRSLATDLSPECEEQLANFPNRLSQLIEPGQTAGELNETVHAAQILAVASRQITPQPLKNVKVHNALAEYPEGPATAILDGVWNSTELTTMWYHPIDKKSTIVLDLGEERTVVGVRVWNFNQPSYTYRGWKEADIYVSKTPSSIEPVSSGIIPQAPGAAETPDYGTLVPVPFVRGRYIKLTARSVWNPNSYTGLAEVQVLGF